MHFYEKKALFSHFGALFVWLYGKKAVILQYFLIECAKHEKKD
jgi:hypothetical protein